MGGSFTGIKITQPDLIDIQDLLPQIAPYLKGCPLPVVIQQLSRASREFFRRTELWTETVASVSTVADQAAYVIANPYTDCASFLRCVRVAFDAPKNYLDDARYTFTPDGTLTLADTPSQAGLSLTPDCVFLPHVGALTLPEYLVVRFQEGLIFGALYFVKSISGFPYSDEKGAAQASQSFRRYCADAKKELLTGLGSGEVPLIPRRFV